MHCDCDFNPVIDIIISCDWTDGDEGGGGGGLVDHLASLAVEPPPDYDQVGELIKLFFRRKIVIMI